MSYPAESGESSRRAQSSSAGASKKRYHSRPKNWLFKGTGKVLANIQSSQLLPSNVPVTSSGGYSVVCSYNWVRESSPTIYAPGDPPRFVSTQPPLRIPKDSGEHFVDQNSFRIPEYPFEVVFRAMEVMNPGYKFNDVDVLINRNTLRKMLDFSHRKCKHAFRINMFTVANTLIVERCEKTTKALVKGSGDAGWGHNFEAAITQPLPGMKDIAGHHRVLRYDFGGLNSAVRFEVDASYSNDTIGTLEEGQSKSVDQVEGMISLPETLSALQIQEPPMDSKVIVSGQIRVIPRGSGVCHTTAAEIKSMTTWKRLGLMLPQLWFGRTQNLIRGVHSKGVFHDIRTSIIEEDLRTWETKDQNQMALRRMATLLSQLRDIVKNSESKACVAVCEKASNPASPVLQVFVATERREALPQDVCEMFWGKE